MVENQIVQLLVKNMLIGAGKKQWGHVKMEVAPVRLAVHRSKQIMIAQIICLICV